MTHTPGPWRWQTYDLDAHYGFVLDAEWRPVCNITWRNAEANANLIAAAPELLAASEALLLAIKDVCGVEPQRRAMIAAHRKAYGETS